MAQLRPIQIGIQAYRARSPVVLAEECQNLYAERNPEEKAKGPIALIGCPGLVRRATVGSGPIRGLQRMGAYLFVVSGEALYRVGEDFTAVEIGAVKGSGNVFMTENGQHVAIVGDKYLYAANASEILELPEQFMVGAAYQDGYGIFGKRGTNQFFITGLDDMTALSALDFSSADTFADLVVGLISDHREVRIFKERSTETWVNSGAAAFPFQRIDPGFMERGCVAGGSIAKAENRVYWLGDDLRVSRLAGYRPEPVSTHGIDKLISERASPQTAWAFTYAQEGHTFYVLSFSDLTIVYDVSTGLWHTRKSWGLDRWRANCHAWIWGQNIVGDYEDGRLYALDLDATSDDGDTIQYRTTSPPLHAAGNRVIQDNVFIDMEMGLGDAPAVMLDWSDDGGRTWSHEYVGSAGDLGEYKNVARWFRLGAYRQRILRFTITDAIKPVILSPAYATEEALAS